MSKSIIDLKIHCLRHISSSEFAFHPRCNLIFGPNGSGKTSILEALYLLCSGHSFRTRENAPLINDGEQTLTLFSRLADQQTISIQKSLTGPTLVKINGQSCHSSSELAYFLPCQVFYQDIFQIIDAGPSVRRTLLDWGLFHVEHSYFPIWKDYRTVLKQRNALLRQQAKKSLFTPWDQKLVELALKLDHLRSNYFMQWLTVFQRVLSELTDIPCEISYFKGWDKKNNGKELAAILEEQFAQDIQRQYTQSGAHQADIYFDLSSKKAKLLLSRGQQKIVLIALKLAQASLVPTGCIYLFDDITAELDAQHVESLLRCLSRIKDQLFITAMDDGIVRQFKSILELNTYDLKRTFLFA